MCDISIITSKIKNWQVKSIMSSSDIFSGGIVIKKNWIDKVLINNHHG